jgi:16S rRNA (cytidine1402-2'-O)-methyltransferase
MGCAGRGHGEMAYRGRGMKDSDPGTLIVAAAPLGQPADASPRLAGALASAEVIAAEDTRRVLRLARELGVKITGRLVSYYNAVDRDRVAELLSAMEAGTDVLLIADAGMPGVSDPGYRLVGAAAEAGITVTVLPGPSAVTAALAVCGLPTDRFCFEGFPPRGAGARERRFAELAAEPRTMVFFESRRRVAETLAELAAAFGPDRQAVACRELTKTHEEIARGTLTELAAWAKRGVLGEITLVVEPPKPRRAGLGRQRGGGGGGGGRPAGRGDAAQGGDRRRGRRNRPAQTRGLQRRGGGRPAPITMRERPAHTATLVACPRPLVTSSPRRPGPTPTVRATSAMSPASRCLATCSAGTSGWRETGC